MTIKIDKDADFARLLEVTYSSTADPELFDDLLVVWEDYMTRTPDIDRSGPHLTHFNKALQIFSSMGRRRRQQGRDDDLLASFSTPAFLCNRDMTLRGMNGAARILLGNNQTGLLTQPDLARAVRALGPSRRTDIVPLTDADGRMTDCAVISLQSAPLLETHHDTSDQPCLIVLTKPGTTDNNAWAQLAARFDLSEAESQVLHGLLTGQNPASIAAARGVSVNTVRTQIRKLLEKTGTPSLADLVRQTLLICTQLETMALAGRMAGDRIDTSPEGERSILTSDGRLLTYRDLGDPDGRPLLFIHNMLGGTALPAVIQRTALRRGWRIIAPSRPGFGRSDAVALKNMDLVERSARDFVELLDHLHIPAALVLGLMSSAGLGLIFANRYPGRTAALLNVAHAGTYDDAMIADMPNPARTMARTFRRSSLATRFLVRVGIAAIDMPGPVAMMRRQIGQSPADSALADDDEMMTELGRLVQHAANQGGDAFTKDGFVALHDFRPFMRSLDPAIPALALLGQDDLVYQARHARRLLPDLPQYPVEYLPNAGQYLFYGQYEAVFDRAERLWAKRPDRLQKIFGQTAAITRIEDDESVRLPPHEGT